MSRSNPQENALPNPAMRRYRFDGSTGQLPYWDVEKKEMGKESLPFKFVLLDITASVPGWDKQNDCAIWSNEVKDTRSDVLVVKSKTGGIIATGLYTNIKKDVNAAGAEFNSNIYLAYRDGTTLRIGALRLKGAALSTWMDFQRQHRADIYEKAIVIEGSDEHKNGSITYRTPVFALKSLTADSQAEALALDTELQKYLKATLARNKVAQVNDAPPDTDFDQRVEYDDTPHFTAAVTEDDIPF